MAKPPLTTPMSNPRPTSAGSKHSRRSIGDRQNASWSLQLLAAQRQLYAEAKRWQHYAAAAVVGSAFLGILTTMFFPSLLVVTGPIGVGIAILQRVVRHLTGGRTKAAAAAQELFDTTVFDLPWNNDLVAKPDPEAIIAANNRYQGDRSSLVNWYTPPAEATNPYDILLCQRTNLRWDATLRERFAGAIVWLIVTLSVTLVIAGTVQGLSLGEFLLSLVPSAGAFLLAYDTARSHRQHAAEQHRLKHRLEVTWRLAVENSRRVKTPDLRSIQDLIYRLRTAAPSVPDWFYWKYRDQYESESRQAVAQMWADFQQRK